MILAYNIETNRIVRSYWGDDEPGWWTDPPAGVETAEEPLSQDSRDELTRKAGDDLEAGEDYNPDTETIVGYLCYDPETGEVYPDAEIRDLSDDEQSS